MICARAAPYEHLNKTRLFRADAVISFCYLLVMLRYGTFPLSKRLHLVNISRGFFFEDISRGFDMQNLFGSVLVPTWQQNRRCWRTEQEVDGRNGSMDNNDFSNFVLIFYMVFAVLVLIFHRINHVQEALGRMFQNKYIHACSLINFFFTLFDQHFRD